MSLNYCLRFRPTAFLGNGLSVISAGFSAFQLGLGQYPSLRLVLQVGPYFPAQLAPTGMAKAIDSTVYHNRDRTSPGRSWAQGYDLELRTLLLRISE
jgi:hypothetical protein